MTITAGRSRVTAQPDAAPRTPALAPASVAPTPLVPSPAAHRLSAALALVCAATTLLTLLIPGILHGPAAMNGSARGTALVMLVAGVPLLLAGQLATRRGHARAVPVWLGAVAYLLYNAVMLLFATPFNGLFLLYVAAFSLALWTLGVVLVATDVARIVQVFRTGVPARPIALFVWTVVALNTLAWLRRIVPALFEGADPTVLDGTGLATVPTYVQDLAVWLPLMAVAAFWLWRGRDWGYLIVAAMLVQWVVEAVTIAVDQFWGASADPESTLVSTAMTPAFAILALVTLVPAVVMLRRR